MVDNKNKGGGEFDDDAFDVEDFSDTDFDEAALDDDGAFDDLPPDDGEFEGDDFESEDWNEEEEPAKKGKKAKKEKSLYQTGERSGLSFNTIVIIGAVVVGGGVMAYNIISKTAEVKSTEKTVFQSILNIGGVMDGTLFGDKEEEPTPEQIAAQEQQTQNEGFLNNPDVVTPPPAVDPNAQANPPQPSPIMPTDGTQAANEPLVPMPETTPSTEAPRGPDDVPPVATTPATEQAAAPTDVAATPEAAPAADVPAAPETTDATATPTAEDILKQAMANREQKASETNAPPAEEAKPADVAAETPAEAPKEEAIADATVPVIPIEEKAPEPATPPAAEPSVSKEDMDASKQALVSLESKLDTILKRMEQIESDLGSVKESKNSEYEQIQQTVQSLKTDIAEIKDRPAAAAPVREKPRAVEEPEAADEPADEPAPAPVKKKAAKKKAPAESSSATPKAVSGRWELRAAQPGRAWVSKPGERDMQTVEIGQSLPGIGRVTGITYQNNRWTVLGTQGQIQQ